jgi:c-di-GMP-binding flagellar brake protein YcgR
MHKIGRNQVVNETVLQVNNKIEIALANDEDLIFGKSLIQEVLDDSFSIMVPIHNGHGLYFKIDDEVIVSLLINNVRYSFKTTVLKKTREFDLKLLVLKMPQKFETADRRTLVRIKTLLPIKYKIIGPTQQVTWEDIEPEKEAYLTDLSGKGLSLSMEKAQFRDVIMVLSLHLGNDTEMKLLGEVVRCEQINKRYRIGLEFIDITERQEDLIISYVFQCLRKTMKLSRDDD